MASEQPATGDQADRQPVHRPFSPAARAVHTARDVNFPMALRGYDRAAVDRYVQEVNQAIAELEITSSPESAIRHALEQVSEETSGLLQRAQKTADEITAESRAQADERTQRAKQEADELREVATREAADIRAKLATELDAMRAEGQARVDALSRSAEAIAAERRRLIDEVMEIAERLGELAREEAQRFLEREEAAREEMSLQRNGPQPDGGN